jgi:pilus assembly protein Flp/PilA
MSDREGTYMRSAFWKIRSGLQNLIQEEEGQDLVEYSLIIAMLAVAAVASMKTLATALANYYQYIVTNYP